MKYNKIYNDIIERGKSRILAGYKETHHIIPKCIGGTNEKSNLVELTCKEHFICHKLLTEIYPTENKLRYAVRMMATTNNVFGRTYKVGAREYSRIKEAVIVSEETKLKISIGSMGHIVSDATKSKISKANKGKSKSKLHRKNLILAKQNISDITRKKISEANSNPSDETRKKMSTSAKNRIPMSVETKLKMSASRMGHIGYNIGMKWSDEAKQKLSDMRKGKKQKIITCPHCGKAGGNATMPRWHFDNCKQKGE